MKTDDLTGAALDWAVMTLEKDDEYAWYVDRKGRLMDDHGKVAYAFQPSTNWAQGGPIIDREKIATAWHLTRWVAWRGVIEHPGPTPLIAAMRCYVASRLGNDIEIPEELNV
jgi:hypothetical protein